MSSATERIPITLPETERIPRTKTLPTARGIPETLAEIYHSICAEENRNYLLYVFDVGNMDRMHRENNGAYVESYRFVSRQPRDVKEEIENKAEKAERYLKFLEREDHTFRAVLRDYVLRDLMGILSDMEKRYS